MKNIFISLLLVLLSGCEQQEWYSADIPDIATDVYVGHPFDDYSKQTSYFLLRKYPDDSMMMEIEKSLTGVWQSCSYAGGSWQDFEDLSGDKPVHIYQRIKTWKKNSKQHIMVALRYESASCQCCNCEPDTEMQKIIILENKIPWWLFWENNDVLCNG